ncbi:AMP-binding protein [Sphingomonas faeni]|uniref:AMP-binding protein n=1 Tax=Sphingomonas faeni TaxID=185950 RepID=UPI0027843219|nr:AMP-binding protein [Sphingomonas faeni]MDQ0839066.1 4-coumarate--CoA ligase (photoactive yellow protein activation family) [Sphingomonas faeni]
MKIGGLRRSAAHRIACAVVAAEVRRLRDGDAARLPALDWPEDMPIGDEGLGLDSIEQLGALGALAETFGLDDDRLGTEPPARVGEWIDWVMAAQHTSDRQIIVATSGSTGAPRLCRHAVADLLDEAAYIAARFADRRRVVAMVPAHHLYGIIWTALLPGVLGIPVVVRTIGAALDLTAGDIVVAVPEQWLALSRIVRRFPDDVVGVSSAGVLDDRVATDLSAKGLARLVDVYGASETSAIAIREIPASTYELLPRWHLAPRDDGDWDLVDSRGARVDLPDRIDRTGDRTLRPIGRRDGAVQVGGHNVWPDRVARILRDTDGVADVAVRLHANGRLKAFIVPVDGRDPADLSATLDRVVADRLTAAERPKSLRFGSSLPRGEMGKLTDWV